MRTSYAIGTALALSACRSAEREETASRTTEEPQEHEPVLVFGGDALPLTATGAQLPAGYEVVAGADLDHDGIAEWFSTNTRSGGDQLLAFEHTTFAFHVETSFGVRCYPRPLLADAGGDTDGDGFGELLLIACDDRIEAVRGPGLAERVELLPAASGDDVWEPLFAIYLHSGEADHILITSTNEGRDTRWDLADLTDEPNGSSVQLGEATLVATYPTNAVLGWAPESRPADLRTEPPSWLGGAAAYNQGYSYTCPARLGIDHTTDCLFLETPEGSSTGSAQVAYDVEGDGVLESVTSGGEAQGSLDVAVFDSQGNPIARLASSDGASLGSSLAGFTDSQGSWLAARRELGGDRSEVRVWGPALPAEASENEAAYAFMLAGNSALGEAMTTYQATPKDPVLLLLLNGFGGEVLPFTFPPPVE